MTLKEDTVCDLKFQFSVFSHGDSGITDTSINLHGHKRLISAFKKKQAVCASSVTYPTSYDEAIE